MHPQGRDGTGTVGQQERPQRHPAAGRARCGQGGDRGCATGPGLAPGRAEPGPARGGGSDARDRPADPRERPRRHRKDHLAPGRGVGLAGTRRGGACGRPVRKGDPGARADRRRTGGDAFRLGSALGARRGSAGAFRLPAGRGRDGRRRAVGARPVARAGDGRQAGRDRRSGAAAPGGRPLGMDQCRVRRERDPGDRPGAAPERRRRPGGGDRAGARPRGNPGRPGPLPAERRRAAGAGGARQPRRRARSALLGRSRGRSGRGCRRRRQGRDEPHCAGLLEQGCRQAQRRDPRDRGLEGHRARRKRDRREDRAGTAGEGAGRRGADLAHGRHHPDRHRGPDPADAARAGARPSALRIRHCHERGRGQDRDPDRRARRADRDRPVRLPAPGLRVRRDDAQGPGHDRRPGQRPAARPDGRSRDLRGAQPAPRAGDVLRPTEAHGIRGGPPQDGRSRRPAAGAENRPSAAARGPDAGKRDDRPARLAGRASRQQERAASRPRRRRAPDVGRLAAGGAPRCRPCRGRPAPEAPLGGGAGPGRLHRRAQGRDRDPGCAARGDPCRGTCSGAGGPRCGSGDLPAAVRRGDPPPGPRRAARRSRLERGRRVRLHLGRAPPRRACRRRPRDADGGAIGSGDRARPESDRILVALAGDGPGARDAGRRRWRRSRPRHWRPRLRQDAPCGRGSAGARGGRTRGDGDRGHRGGTAGVRGEGRLPGHAAAVARRAAGPERRRRSRPCRHIRRRARPRRVPGRRGACPGGGDRCGRGGGPRHFPKAAAWRRRVPRALRPCRRDGA